MTQAINVGTKHSVGLSIVLIALFCLQLDYDLAKLASPDSDDIGNSLAQRRYEARRLVRPASTN